MSWSYDLTLPAPKDKVRLLCGDTDTTRQLVTDEAIAFFLTEQNQNVYFAAAEACEAIASSFAQAIDRTIGGMSLRLSSRYQNYMDRAERLRALGRQQKPGKAEITQEDSGEAFYKGMHDLGGPFYPAHTQTFQGGDPNLRGQ